MDRKSIIILAASVGIVFILFRVIDRVFPPKTVPAPVPVTASTQTAASNLPAAAPPSVSSPAPARKEPLAAEHIETVNSGADLIWHFTSHGGGLKTVDLIKYPALIMRGAAQSSQTNPASLNQNAPLPVLAVTSDALAGDDDYVLTKGEGGVVRAEKDLPGGLRVVKEFQTGTNYLFTARLWFENTSGQPLRVPARNVIVGTATVVGALDDPTSLGTFWYNGLKAQHIQDKWFANPTMGCFPGTPRGQYVEGASNVVWAAVHSQFFVLAAMPGAPAPEVVIDKIRVPPPNLSGPTNSMSARLTNGYQMALVYPTSVLAPGQKIETSFTFYAGPKEYNGLARIGDKMGNHLDLVMDFSGFFGFFSKLLLLGMDGLHDFLGLPYGLTIIAITVIIKVVFWPLTNASNKSQKRMQALQPQLKLITDKYKDDPAKKQQKTMEFYKQNKVNPMGSCLPTLLQIPVFFGFYWMLRGAIELRGASFLWAFDLSQPDTVASPGGFPINPLPLIMGATQLWQSHMMPPSPGMEPGQQKLMRYMPLMMLALFYRMSAALNLYWTVQNLLSILQLKLTKTASQAAPAPAPAIMKKKR